MQPSPLLPHLQARWSYVSRTIPGAEEEFSDLEDSIRHLFLPALLGRPVSDDERELLSIPARFGGMGISNPSSLAPFSLELSRELCLPLMRLVLRQADDFDPSELRQDQNIKAKQELDREEHWKRTSEAIILKAPPSTQKAIREAREKVASNWVTTRPLDSHHTILHKGDFRDAVFIRYNWQPPFLPDTCCCGANFSLQHALDCQTGGYRTLQHDEVKQVVAELLKEAHFAGVEIEPRLQPLSGESFLLKSVNKDDEARSDVKCLGFWTEDCSQILLKIC